MKNVSINLHIFSLINVSNFRGWICKIERYFYFPLIDANAINAIVFALFRFENESNF